MPSKTKKLLFISASERPRPVLNAFPFSISVKISVKFPQNFRVLEIQFISVTFPTAGNPERSISAEHGIAEFSDLRIALMAIFLAKKHLLSRLFY